MFGLFNWSDQCTVAFVFLPLSIVHLVCSTINVFDDYSFFPLLDVVNEHIYETWCNGYVFVLLLLLLDIPAFYSCTG